MLVIAVGTRRAAGQLRLTASKQFFSQLVLALWLLVAKAHAKRGQAAALQEEVAKFDGIPARRAQDLWCRMMLHALADMGFLPTAERKYYRRNPHPLHGINEGHLNELTTKFGSLREMLRRFSQRRERPPEDLIYESVVRLRRLLEENPELELPDSILAIIEDVWRSTRSHSTARPRGHSTRGDTRTPGSLISRPRSYKPIHRAERAGDRPEDRKAT